MKGVAVTHALTIGVDVGGTGIKAAAVRVSDGELVTPRRKILTPEGGKPDDVADAVAGITNTVTEDLREIGETPHANVGVCVPAVVKNGVTLSAANIDQAWIGLEAEELLSERLGTNCALLNDADAAGEAELDFGAAANQTGLTLVLTLGTGIGSALLSNGVLVPGAELGHIELNGVVNYEHFASPKNIKKEGLSLEEWAARVTPYMQHLEMLFTPSLFVLGGSISKNSDDFLPFKGVHAPVVPAHFLNNAGIVGSASFAAGH